MKVILLSDVAKLGKKNDIVNVNDGYGTNFLIKKKLAVLYTPTAVERLNSQLEVDQQNREQAIGDAYLLKQKIESMELVFYLNTNHGNAFGFISTKQLLDQINAQEKLVNKYMLINEHQWGLGEHLIDLQLHKEVIAKLKIKVLGQ